MNGLNSVVRTSVINSRADERVDLFNLIVDIKRIISARSNVHFGVVQHGPSLRSRDASDFLYNNRHRNVWTLLLFHQFELCRYSRVHSVKI